MLARTQWRTAIALLGAAALAACGTDSGSGGGGGTSAEAGGFNAEQFFRGKTIEMIVTHSAGGGSDLFGRFIADHLADTIPGKPRVTVTNDSGIGGISNAFNAPADALVIGVSSQGSVLYTTVLDPEANIDPSKVQMIGATGGDPRALALFTDAATSYDPLSKAANATAPRLKFAYTVGSPVDLVSDPFFASWLCETLKAPCQMLSVADDDSTDLNLMVQRGEINTQLGTLITMIRDYNAQLSDGSVKIGAEFAQDENTIVKPPAGVALPDIVDVIPAEAKPDYERILPIVGGGDVGKNLWAGPGVSADVVDTLRTAYADLVKDPAVVDELQTVMSGGETGGGEYTVSPVNGEEAQSNYETAAKSFQDNLSYYKELQTQYYDKYWK
jgi:hypothetical protein